MEDIDEIKLIPKQLLLQGLVQSQKHHSGRPEGGTIVFQLLKE